MTERLEQRNKPTLRQLRRYLRNIDRLPERLRGSLEIALDNPQDAARPAFDIWSAEGADLWVWLVAAEALGIRNADRALNELLDYDGPPTCQHCGGSCPAHYCLAAARFEDAVKEMNARVACPQCGAVQDCRPDCPTADPRFFGDLESGADDGFDR